MDWPTHLCDILGDDYEIEIGPTTRRTNYESGEVSEKSDDSRQRFTRNFTIAVTQPNFTQFQEWCKENAAAPFQFYDYQDGQTRAAQIVGGRVRLVPATDRKDGVRYWTARLVLDGLA